LHSYDALRYFIETSFHEDWDVEGPTDRDAVASFVSRDRAEVMDVVAEIKNYLASNPSSDTTKEWLDRLGCAYDPTPDGIDVNQWLKKLSEMLLRSL
jgi:hypothetical protein